ncbi:hypothetical protein T484DRAFT_1804121, partial [Baffinella frigidus]
MLGLNRQHVWQVPRHGDLRYLEPTLQAIADQLPLDTGDPLYGEVLVVVLNNKPGTHKATLPYTLAWLYGEVLAVVLNNKPGTHKVFDELKAKFEGGPHALYFKFVEQSIQQDDTSHNPENNAN